MNDMNKSLLNFVNINTEEVENLCESDEELKVKLEHLERYSRDLGIRILGVNESEGEDCLKIIMDFITSLGFDVDPTAEEENAHCMGKRCDDKPSHIIANLYSRLFKRKLIQVARSDGRKETLGGVRTVEDPSPCDFEIRQKAIPLMNKAYDEGQEIRFTRGILLVDGRVIPVI